MSEDSRVTRRRFLTTGFGGMAGLLFSRIASAVTPKSKCPEETPEQTAGPFFPTRKRADEDMDLTQVKGRSGRAAGEVIYVRGKVVDDSCRPVAGALIEIWQANQWGRYDHEGDAENPQPLDPNFQGWAKFVTAKDGTFSFKSIKPGSYPADDSGWIRPPHIHFKIARKGYHELTTQMYFAGEPLNEPDQIRKALSPEERKSVTVEFGPAPKELGVGSRLGNFDIALRKVT